MNSITYKTIISTVIIGVIVLFTNSVTRAQSLGNKIASFKVSHFSLDKYDQETKEWSNNAFIEVTDESKLDFYDKGIVLYGAATGEESIYYIDVLVEDNVWYVYENPGQYCKIKLYRTDDGIPVCSLNYLNGSIIYTRLRDKK
jgi:hypothetical protein